MEIRQFRVVLRARNFDRTCRFYAEVLTLPRLSNWDNDEGRGAIFQVGSGAIEVLGRVRGIEDTAYDETYDFVGPRQKLLLSIQVPSAEQVYEELIFRDRNVPGGLRTDGDGALVFETHDPDGVKILFKQAGG